VSRIDHSTLLLAELSTLPSVPHANMGSNISDQLLPRSQLLSWIELEFSRQTTCSLDNKSPLITSFVEQREGSSLQLEGA
jgi:hypothetical protein